MIIASLAPQSAGVTRRDAFLPAEAHVSQNPVLVVVEVDLASLGKERVSQFSRDAIEAMVQVGLETVGVVVGIESCQDRESAASLRAPGLLRSGDTGGMMGCTPQRLSFNLYYAEIVRSCLTAWEVSNLGCVLNNFFPPIEKKLHT